MNYLKLLCSLSNQKKSGREKKKSRGDENLSRCEEEEDVK